MSEVSTFRSFIDRTPSIIVGDDRVPMLFPDERIIARCDGCRCKLQMGQTFDAKLVSTNYRLLIIKKEGQERPDVPRRMRAVDERISLPLCGIHSLRYADSSHNLEGGSGGGGGLGGALSPFRANLRRSRKGEKGGGGGGGEGKEKKRRKSTERELKQFKPLKEAISSMEVISCLKVYMKDMRVLFIDLRAVSSASNLANHLLLFSRPSRADKLPGGGGGDGGRRVPFTTRSCWEEEMRRHTPRERQSMWRVVDLGAETIQGKATSYPPCIVTCAGLSMGDIREGVHAWAGGRFPVWVYAWRDCVLMRSGLPVNNSHAAAIQRKFEDRIAGTHDSSAVPHVLRLDGAGSELTAERVAAAFEKLHKICAVDNSARAYRYGRVWPARVAETGWLQAVGAVLQVAADAVSRLVDTRESVWLQEAEGRDCSAVVSSIVQICLEKEARRMEGLRRVVEKNWIALGHPFSRRLLSVEDAPFCPLFLLFLDALYQLVEEYPSQFEYTSSALVALWDLTLTGTVGTMSCEHAAEMGQLRRTSSAFPLDAHYTEPYSLLFRSVPHAAAAAITRSGRGLPLIADIIRPPTAVANLRLWNECYLRWQPEAVVKGGGPLLASWSLDRLMDEKRAEIGGWTMTIGELEEEWISSCFPYAPSRDDDDEAGAIGRTERPSIGSIASLATLQITPDSDYQDYCNSPTLNIAIPEVRYHSASVGATSGYTVSPPGRLNRYHSITVSDEEPVTPTATVRPTVPEIAYTPPNGAINVNNRPVSVPVRQAPPVPPKNFTRSYV